MRARGRVGRALAGADESVSSRARSRPPPKAVLPWLAAVCRPSRIRSRLGGERLDGAQGEVDGEHADQVALDVAALEVGQGRLVRGGARVGGEAVEDERDHLRLDRRGRGAAGAAAAGAAGRGRGRRCGRHRRGAGWRRPSTPRRTRLLGRAVLEDLEVGGVRSRTTLPFLSRTTTSTTPRRSTCRNGDLARPRRALAPGRRESGTERRPAARAPPASWAARDRG